ncbi:MAG TPA: cytochrome c3 family protein [Candidatus Hydrogenedentes bacterium]|nr:cytochrome c3 family protein [Candidatus Hydrogenedentota bacterium]HOV74004.1 cytochrome c3 family protein [Candidatus Hydrogenedentota bacterium]
MTVWRRIPLAAISGALLLFVAVGTIGPSGCELTGGNYLGTEVCLSCHDGRVAGDKTGFRMSTHYMIGCESCHGPGLQHVRNGRPGNRYIETPPNTFDGINAACLRCHWQEATDYAQGAHAESRTVTCLHCHDIHAFGETRLSFKNNRLCLECHRKGGFDSVEAIETHTWHSVDPTGSGTSRCTTCHMPPMRRKSQSTGTHRHTLFPVQPITSNEAADAGAQPVPPNSCAGILGCHDGPNIYIPHFSVDDPWDNLFLQAIYEYRYPQAGGL